MEIILSRLFFLMNFVSDAHDKVPCETVFFLYVVIICKIYSDSVGRIYSIEL